MRLNLHKQLAVALFSCLSCIVTSCRDDVPDFPSPDPADKVSRTVLIYAVATNSLSGDLSEDRIEMQKAAASIAGLGKDVNVLLYATEYRSHPALYQLTTIEENVNGNIIPGSFHKIKEYDDGTFSTDPARIAEVIDDVAHIRPADDYGLVLWSHATGWTPDFSNHHKVPQRAFGQDKGSDGTYDDWCDVIDLAEAIPAGMFDFIWFDCCYMSSIEVAYQLRDKCRYMVAYPTEDWAYGMPYDETLPLIAREHPDLEEASKKFFDWYDTGLGWPVTICMVDMQGMENVARTAHYIYKEGKMPDTTFGLLCYSRGKIGPFYDFAQYTKSYRWDNSGLTGDSEEAVRKFEEAMDDFVVVSFTGKRNFDNILWDYENYSGLSVHFPGTVDARKEAYYRTLDWYKAVYE